MEAVLLNRVLIREFAAERQEWARERLLLLETICHLAGRPLPRRPAPADDWTRPMDSLEEASS